MLKADPEDEDLADMVARLKTRHADKKRQVGESKYPEEQLRGTYQRLRRLKEEVESFSEKMREACIVEEEAAKKADGFHQKILAHNAEIERLRTEAKTLQSKEVQPVSKAADVAKVVETLRGGYQQYFTDASLPHELQAQKTDVETALAQLAEVLRNLSQFDVSIQAARMAADAGRTRQQEQQQQSSGDVAAAAAPQLQVAVHGASTTAPGVPAVSVEGAAGSTEVVAMETGVVRSSGQKSVRDSTNEELMAIRAGRRKTEDGAAWVPDI